MAEHHSYPALFYAANAASESAQRWFLRLSACRLWALVTVAALAALVGLIDRWSASIALVPISVALFAEIMLWARRPEQRWYQARAVAESAKTLAWRYQVGGRPLGRQVTDHEADTELIARLRGLLDEFHDLPLPATHQDQVTAHMRELRSLPLEERIAAYRKGRIEDQRAWYADKADWNRKRGDYYQVGLIVIELAAFGTALVTALQGLSVSVYSLLAALAVAGSAGFRSSNIARRRMPMQWPAMNLRPSIQYSIRSIVRMPGRNLSIRQRRLSLGNIHCGWLQTRGRP